MNRKVAEIRALDGHGLAEAIAAGTRAIERNRDTINALNVFPVPDGDTGTNMSLTMQKVVADVRERPSADVSSVARLMARSSLLAARGNSGLILAQFFKGLANAANGATELDARCLARGLRLATEAAYKAVPDPREGTMLTVFREAAEAADREAAGEKAGSDLVAVWDAACRQAKDAVRRTPELLDVLRDAGVVDAGGFGFAALLAGGLSSIKGESDGSIELDVPGGARVAYATAGAGGPGLVAQVRADFVARMETESWGYCVSFAVEGDRLDPDAIRARASNLGKSCVVAGDERQVKVHLHTMDPGEPLSYGVSLGTVSNVAVLNMDEQSREWARTQAGAAAAAGQSMPASSGAARLPVAVVAVVAGDGLAKLFTANGLGACSIVPGGDSMNPSAGDIAAAVEAAPASDVIILPNNRNVIGTAGLVRGLTTRSVHVVPTSSMQAGIAALLAFSTDQPVEENVDAMTAAAATVKAIAFCYATRDSRVDGIDVRRGQAMGIVDGKLAKTGDAAATLVVDLLSEVARDAELVTLYRGAEVSRPEADRVAAVLRDRLPGIAVEVIDGDQPFYPYLVSVE
jgi:DAK2 domain fusion protein YloV